MTLPARPWLPANALADATVQAMVRDSAMNWAARWLIDPRDIIASTQKVSSPIKISDAFTCWTNATGALTLAVDQASAIKLAAQMIGAPAGGKPNAADLSLYHRLARDCCLNLLSDLAALFGCDGDFREAKQHEANGDTKYTLAFAAGGPSFDLYVDRALMIYARQSSAKGARPPIPLGVLGEAIGRQHISVGAAAGGATIGLDDLYALACGDVIVLDKALDDDVRMTVNGHVAPSATAFIRRSETGLELRMTQTGFEQT